MTRQPPPGMNETIAAEVEGRTPAPVSHLMGGCPHCDGTGDASEKGRIEECLACNGTGSTSTKTVMEVLKNLVIACDANGLRHLPFARDARRLVDAAPSPAPNVVGSGEPIAYVCEADIRELANKPDGTDMSIAPRPFPEYGMKFPLYAAPSHLMGWQTMDSAPKDGTMIWVLDALYNQPWHYECRWNGIQWYHGFGTAWPRANPSHWMPLPPSPAASEGLE